jgi:hypothetical protein
MVGAAGSDQTPKVSTGKFFFNAATGNVGIGTSTPTELLQVSGTTRSTTYRETYTTASSSSGSLTIDTSLGNIFQVTLTEVITSTTFSNPPPSGTGYGMTVRVIQDSTTRTIAWPTSVDWSGGLAPEISQGSGEVDIFTFFTTDGGSTWYGFTNGKAML